MIYLDNAATTMKKPPQVLAAVLQAMEHSGNAARGAHGGALQAARTVYAARESLAAFFGCPRADHVVFTANSTEALNLAILGLVKPGEHIITTVQEHNSVLRPLYYLEKTQGVQLDFVGLTPSGELDYAQMEALIGPKTSCIVCNHASNLTGDVADLQRVGLLAKRHGLYFIVDASQTAGVLPLDMTQQGIDLLCFTGHKGLMGPQGTGGLCIRPGLELRPLKHGGSGVHSYDREQPREYPTRLEAGTLNSHGIAGLAAGVDFIRELGLSAIREKEQQLMTQFHQGVLQIPGIRVYGNFQRERCAIVALNLGEEDSAAVADALEQHYGIATRAGAHCAPLMHRALGTTQQGAVRFSFSYFNTPQEVSAAIRALQELAE